MSKNKQRKIKINENKTKYPKTCKTHRKIGENDKQQQQTYVINRKIFVKIQNGWEAKYEKVTEWKPDLEEDNGKYGQHVWRQI